MSSLHEASIPGRHEYLICVLLGLIVHELLQNAGQRVPSDISQDGMTEWQLLPNLFLGVTPSLQQPNSVPAQPPIGFFGIGIIEWQLLPNLFLGVTPSLQQPNSVPAQPPIGFFGIGIIEWQLLPNLFLGVTPSLQQPNSVPLQPPIFFLEGLGSGPG
jgi:hypothetical protein